ncbi:mitochondrial basic amino acids transporter isoform X1 [Periplaneta americana]|uniref:mitochondrial basic amino acids transporter isoform X1 n=2 Tax=Periplaneta americana TaxID=6978 RepID=UPI0037E75413
MALDFIAGCLGGCAGVLVGHPFDTVKVRLQTQDFRNPQYKGAIDCLTNTLKKESVSGLYKGMSSPLAGVAVVNAIVFGVYGHCQRHLPQPDALSSHFMAGAAAGLVQSFVCCPMELVKTRLQLQGQHCYNGPLHCLAQVAKTEGVRGVFRGLGTTICREVPGFGTYFLAYEFLTRSAGAPVSTAYMLLAGGLSGTLSWVLTYPIDVVKSRLQVDGMGGVYKYRGFVDCLKKSIQAEGYGVMIRGLNSTILRAFPTNAATFTVVTWVIRWANANQIDDNSGYIIGDFVDITAEEMPVQKKPFDHPFGNKPFGLWETLQSKEKYMKNLFQWRKTVLRDVVESNVFCRQYLIPTCDQVYSSGKEMNNSQSLSEFGGDMSLYSYVTEGNEMQSKDEESAKDGVSSSDVSDSEKSHKETTNSEKQPNTYEHKNDYYNSSVR